MDQKQTRIIGALMAIVLVCWLFIPLAGTTREPEIAIAQVPLQFDKDHAFRSTGEFVIRFPRRELGSIESRQSTGYLIEQLKRLGYSVTYAHFDAVIAGRRQVGRNIIASKPGQLKDTVAVVAHYDTTASTFQGAMDNGSGIGVLLELARVFSSSPLNRSLLIIALDGEEWGMLGARDLVDSMSDRSRIAAVLSLDYVGVGELANLTLDTIGQSRGSTPPWMRQIARQSAVFEGVEVKSPTGLRELLDRAVPFSASDQGPFLNAGMPALNLGSDSVDRQAEENAYHSMQDTIEKLKAVSFEKYGRVAERIIRTLDALPRIPNETMETFAVRQSEYLSAFWISILHGLTFLPILAALYFHWSNNRQYLGFMRIGREILAFMGTVLPFLAVYYGIVIFRLLRLIPGYSLYPPNPRDLLMSSRAWGVMAGLFLIGLVIALGGYFSIRLLFRKMVRSDFWTGKTILLALLLCVIAGALTYNSYWAVLFLALPAWIWCLIGLGQGAGGRAANWIWIMAAAMPGCAVLVMRGGIPASGWKTVWYAILALNSGMFTLHGYVLAAAALAIGVRMMAIQCPGRLKDSKNLSAYCRPIKS